MHPLKLACDNCTESVRVKVLSSLEVLAAGSLLATFVAQFMMSDRASRCSSEVRTHSSQAPMTRPLHHELFINPCLVEPAGGGGTEGVVSFVARYPSKPADSSNRPSERVVAKWVAGEPAG